MILKAARIVAIVWLLKLVVTAGLYGLTRVMDIEQLRITDVTRDSVMRAGGGRFVRLRDGWTHYEVAGPDSAPVVVLAAGASVPGYIWQPTFDTLRASGYRVIRYDYYGRGWSDRPKIPLTQDVYVHQLAELLDSLGVTRPITLAGLSYGGTVITSFAAAHPDKVGALVYVDPAIHRPRQIPWYIRIDPIGDLVFQWQSRGWAEGQLNDFLHPERFPRWPDLYRPQMRYKGFRRSRLSDAEANAAFDQRPQLAEVGRHPRPVLIVWGRQDRTVPFHFSDSLLAAMPRAKLVAVDSAGHLPQWEQPAVTHAALLDFLRAQTPKAKLPVRTSSGPGALGAASVRRQGVVPALPASRSFQFMIALKPST
jgi:pimeloyl-ACP methyl ester carboxylesterase